MRNSKDTRTAAGADQDHLTRALCPMSLSFGGRRCSRPYWDDARRVKQLVALCKPVRSVETYLDDLTSFVFPRCPIEGNVGFHQLALPRAVATKLADWA
jgi:hypothetical protein